MVNKRKKILKAYRNTIKDNSNEVIKIKDILHKIQSKTVEQLRIYTRFARAKMYEYDLEGIEAFSKLLSDRDKKLILCGHLYKKDIEQIKKKNPHNTDGRSYEELLTTLIIHNIIESITVIDCNNLNFDLTHNYLASKEDLQSQNSKPDFLLKKDDYTINIEQQTSTKKYQNIYIKKHKLNSLKKENAYLLQMSVKDNKSLYACIDTKENFVSTEIKMDNNSKKTNLKSANKIEYKTLKEAMNQIIEYENIKRNVKEEKIEKIIREAKIRKDIQYKNKKELFKDNNSIVI